MAVRRAPLSEGVESHRFFIEAIGSLASGVAHDFNNLVGVIMGNNDLLIGTLGPETQRAKHLVQIKLAAARGARRFRYI
jgi:two-component system cell cycle sensor histidine kinase/response regulator CckA